MLTTRKIGAATKVLTAVVAATAIVLGALVTAPAAWAGTDDYPAKWKNIPRDSTFDTWGMYNRECTSWVAWRLHGKNHFEIPFHANADKWGPRAQALGYTVNTTPAVGAVAWWDTMHVAWVEAVNPDNTVTIEEYNIGGSGKYDEKIIPTTRPTGYIHFQDLATSFADGAYVSHGGNVYRMAGGAPLFVATWTDWGKKPVGLASNAQWAALRVTPADGTFLTTKTTKKIYRIVGGAPVYISSWDVVGGKQANVLVNDAVIDNAGAPSGNPYRHLKFYPAKTSYVVASPSNTVYQIVDGTAEPVAAEEDVASDVAKADYVTIGDDDIANAGAKLTDPFAHIRGRMTAPVPTIRGTVKIGRTIEALHGKWAPGDVTYSYTWLRRGLPVGHLKTYKVTAKDHMATLTVVITGTKTNFRTLTVTSLKTIKVPK